MNSVCLVGRLTKDPDVRYTTSNEPIAVARFSIAIDDGYGDKKRTDFPSIVVFGKQAENCEKYLNKGSRVGIVGKIQTGSYEKDGRKVYTTDVVANRVEFLESKKSAEPSGMTEADAFDGFRAMDDDVPW